MKIFVFVLTAVLFSASSVAGIGSDSSLKASAPTIQKPVVVSEAVVSDDGALGMSTISHPDGQVAAIVVVDRASEATFVFPIEDRSAKKSGVSEPGLQSEDGAGTVPDGATLDFMGCSGAVCTYGVLLGDSYLGTLTVDYSGPQPKATFQPSQ